jgi:hypothetical protein
VLRSAGLVLVSEMRVRGWPGGGSVAALAIDEPGRAPRRLWPSPGPGTTTARGAPADGDPSCTEPPAPEAFSPHGLTAAPAERGRVRVAVVSHAPREAIELFELSGGGDSARLAWAGCVPLPPDTAGNDVALAPDGEIIVSNYMPTLAGLRGTLSFLSGALGRETGDVMAWRPEKGWRHLAGTRAASPNGVAVTRDGSSVFYAETGAGRVERVPRRGAPHEAERAEIAVEGRPDNLSWTIRNTLLVATHAGNLSFLACAFGRSPCRSGWSIFEIDPVTLRAARLLYHDGRRIGAASAAAELGDRLYLGTVFGDRIGLWRRAP